jgi:putative hydrolase of the HAD superfamily
LRSYGVGRSNRDIPVSAAQKQREALEFVFFDIGGVMYDDRVYANALRQALRDAGASFADEAFEIEYTKARAEQRGPFRRRLADRFLGSDADIEQLERMAAPYWAYPADALESDVRSCLDVLRNRFRLGVIANQPSAVRTALDRDGLADYFEVLGLSDDLGLRKPDPRLFEAALEAAGVEGARAAMVGDRLDYDMRPARQVGMRTVWVLRGEAPEEPTDDQLSETDAAIHDLGELPAVLAEWADVP